MKFIAVRRIKIDICFLFSFMNLKLYFYLLILLYLIPLLFFFLFYLIIQLLSIHSRKIQLIWIILKNTCRKKCIWRLNIRSYFISYGLYEILKNNTMKKETFRFICRESIFFFKNEKQTTVSFILVSCLRIVYASSFSFSSRNVSGKLEFNNAIYVVIRMKNKLLCNLKYLFFFIPLLFQSNATMSCK